MVPFVGFSASDFEFAVWKPGLPLVHKLRLGNTLTWKLQLRPVSNGE